MFVLRQVFGNVRKVFSYRTVSTSNPIVNLSIDNERIATVTLQKPPVNSLCLDLLNDLIVALDEVEKNECKALILTSSLHVFSAGLDVKELYKPDLKRAELFHASMFKMWIKLFGSKYITAAAISGHAPAGACLLALACEYRVMVEGDFTIGLNESKLGLAMTKWPMIMMTHTIPVRDAEFAVTTGKMFSVDEALKAGLIDESAKNKEEAIDICKNFIRQFDGIPPEARASNKLMIRQDPLTWMQTNQLQDKQEFLANINNSKTQKSLEEYFQNLKKKKIKTMQDNSK